MADKTELAIDSPERVAYDLMKFIASNESQVAKDKWQRPDARTYYLTLYHQCIKAGHGNREMSDVLATD